MSKTLMRGPVKILAKSEGLVHDGIKQYFIAVDKEEAKFDTLVDLFKNSNSFYCMYGEFMIFAFTTFILEITLCVIFCNTKKGIDGLFNKLKENNITVSAMVTLNLFSM